MGTVSIRHLEKNFGRVSVIRDVDIDVADGEFAVLVGPSGCGKSTLLRMIAGLEEISGGEISIGGRVVNALPPKARDIAMVFQNYALYPHMTVRENMGFSLFLSGRSKAEIAAEVGRAAEILGLAPLLERRPSELSGGQRQRVAMGRAIVRRPSVFLFDEPLSNLDAKLRVKMRSEIKALHQALNPTVVYVTHDQIEAMTMADKIIVLDGGEVSQIGSPLDLYDHPANLFVATFIGSPAMNVLDAVVDADGGLRLGDGQRLRVAAAAAPGTAVVLGLRPEHLDVADAPDDALTATVRVIEPTGAETHITADLAGTEIVAVLRKRVRLRPGDPIRLTVEPGRPHLFDSKTRLALDKAA
jgi:multiple sugar transport system ATP-binding protein